MKKCTRPDCGKPLDTEGTPNWCKACRAKYQREYRAIRDEMKETRGFAAGVTAMRHAAAERFKGYGSGKFSGLEVSAMIRKMPGPGDVQDEVVVRAQLP